MLISQGIVLWFKMDLLLLDSSLNLKTGFLACYNPEPTNITLVKKTSLHTVCHICLIHMNRAADIQLQIADIYPSEPSNLSWVSLHIVKTSSVRTSCQHDPCPNIIAYLSQLHPNG